FACRNVALLGGRLELAYRPLDLGARFEKILPRLPSRALFYLALALSDVRFAFGHSARALFGIFSDLSRFTLARGQLFLASLELGEKRGHAPLVGGDSLFGPFKHIAGEIESPSDANAIRAPRNSFREAIG